MFFQRIPYGKRFPKLQYLMVRRFFTHLVLALGLLSFTGLKAQQVRFELTPNTVTAAVGDTVKLDVVVTNFTNILSMDLALDWDPTLFDTIKPMVDRITLPNANSFDFNVEPTSSIRISWNQGGTNGTVPNGQAIFRLRFKVKRASTNLWARFKTSEIEVVQNNTPITATFGNLGNPPGSVSTPLVVKTSTHTVQTNQSVCVGVTADNFSNIEIAEWTMKWDSTVLRFDSLTKLNTTLGFSAANFGTSQAVANGRLYFSWNATPPKTVPNGDTLYKVCFKAIGATSTSSQVQTLLPGSEIYRNGAVITLTPQNGTVSISTVAPPPTGGLTFSGSTETGRVGDTVCVRVFAKNFRDIAIMTWSMHWDSTKMSLVKARIRNAQLGTDSLILATATPINCTGGPCFSSPTSAFNYKQTQTGTLTFLMDLSSAPQTFTADSTLVFDICLKINAGTNTTSNLSFDGKPLKIQVLDGNFPATAPIVPVFVSGKINIGEALVPAIVETSNITHVNCTGGTTGGVSLTVSGGTGTFAYSWMGPNGFTEVTKDIASRPAGSYSVTITSGAATPKVSNFTITEPTAALTSSKVITNINCFGQTTGAVVLTPTGGTAPYRYLWNSTETTKDISSKAAGNYSVVITDAKGCTKSETADITQPSAALASSKVLTNVNCFGQATGSAVLTITGGSAPYTYLWSSNETTKDISSKAAGNYSVVITDAKGCTKSETADITQPSATLASSKVVTNVNCGQTTGTIVLTVTGGTAPYTYLWNGGETTKDLSGKGAGSYSVTITDSKNCTKIETADITLIASTLASSKVITNINCFGQTTGAVVLTATGGATPYTYLWSSSETTKDISGKAAGTYNVTITDANGCSKTETADITQPTAALSSSKVVTNVNCFGQATGSVVLTATGGTAPYTYRWSGEETTKDLSNKAAGSYSVTITDAKGCTKIETADITQPSAALSATSNVTNIKCNVGNDGAIALTVAGGTAPYTYSWTGPNSFPATTKDITNLVAGGYSVTLTDSKGCAHTLGPIQVTEPAAIVITPSVTNASCGTSTGAINVTIAGGSAPFTYKWTGPTTFPSTTTQNISALEVGAYTLEVTDNNGCKKTASISVSTTNPSFTVGNTSTNVACKEGANGTINLTVTGGNGTFTYAWGGPNFSATTKDIATLKAGTYNVTVTEPSTNCKVIPAAIVITEPTAMAISTPQIVDVRCKGDASGEITLTVSGGTSPYTYSWTSPNGFTAINTRAIGTLKAGVYNVTVTDDKGCTKSSTAEVKEPTGNALTIGAPSVTNAKCNGASTGAIVISVSGGTPQYTYVWSGPNGFTSTQQNPSNLAAGIYKVTATDNNGCKVISNDITVGQPAAIVITGAVTNAISACNGKIDIAVTGGTGGYAYTWAGKDVSVTSEDQISLCPGETFTVTVTDANLCTATRAFTVTGTIAPPIRLTDSTVVSQAGCPGQGNGAIEIGFSGGKTPFTYEWLNSNSVVVGRSKDISRLAAGKYRVKIIDAVNQSYLSGEIEIKESASTINIVTASTKPQSCSGTDGEIRINVSGGVVPYKYVWNNGAFSKDLLGVAEGNYSVTVMDNNNCLGDKKDLAVERNLCPLTVNSTVKTVNCFGDKASVTISIQNGEPGYVINWGTNQTVRINNTPLRDGSYEITNLAAGAYTFTITDARGQSTTTSVTITQPEEIKIAKFVSNDSGNCSGSIVLAVTGGSPQYTYVWNDGLRSRDRFNLCTGQILSVTVTDSKGCFAFTQNDTIRSGVKVLVLNPNVNIANAACPDDATGRIDITVEGGVRPYKYTWSNTTSLEDAVNLKPGTYTVTVQDNTSPTPQRVIGSYVIGSSSSLKIKDLVTTTSAATVTIEGGEAPYVITWCNATVQNTSNLIVSQSNLAAGTCGVTITDSKGCKVSRLFDVTASCAVVVPSVNLSGGFNLPCSSSKGSATVQTVTDQSLTPPYLFRWDNNESGNSAFQLTAGARTVTVVGNNGKTCIANFVMRAPTDLKVIVTPNPSGKDCALGATPSGGVAPYKYKWSTAKGDTTAIIENQANSSRFFIIVTDTNGCGTDPGVGEVICNSYCLQGGAVLTPNDDAKNDRFDIQKCDFKNIRLQVYNRWGQLVYLNTDYTDQWEGYNQDGKTGKELPEGVYMYVLKGVEPNGKETTNKGTVTILRQ